MSDDERSLRERLCCSQAREEQHGCPGCCERCRDARPVTASPRPPVAGVVHTSARISYLASSGRRVASSSLHGASWRRDGVPDTACPSLPPLRVRAATLRLQRQHMCDLKPPGTDSVGGRLVIDKVSVYKSCRSCIVSINARGSSRPWLAAGRGSEVLISKRVTGHLDQHWNGWDRHDAPKGALYIVSPVHAPHAHSMLDRLLASRD